MSEDPNEEQLKSLASQLSCPTGEPGLRVAENMAANNSGMIQAAIEALKLDKGDVVLEIGPGGCSHLDSLMEQAVDLNYMGVDISPLMVEEARRINSGFVHSGQAKFLLSDGEYLSFPDEAFDKIFTVNTLYFWKDPVAYAQEIARVLKPKGVFCLCFAPKEFMEHLPFTKYVFKLYTLGDAERSLKAAGLDIKGAVKHTELVKVGADESIEREFFVVSASRTSVV